jgi:hypothetical protein
MCFSVDPSSQIFHGDESLPIFPADVIDGAYIWMVQGGSRLSLTLKAAQGLRISGDAIGQKFECDKAVQPGVLRLVHHAHAAAPEPFDNAVMRYSLADHSDH